MGLSEVCNRKKKKLFEIMGKDHILLYNPQHNNRLYNIDFNSSWPFCTMLHLLNPNQVYSIGWLGLYKKNFNIICSTIPSFCHVVHFFLEFFHIAFHLIQHSTLTKHLKICLIILSVLFYSAKNNSVSFYDKILIYYHEF